MSVNTNDTRHREIQAMSNNRVQHPTEPGQWVNAIPGFFQAGLKDGSGPWRVCKVSNDDAFTEITLDGVSGWIFPADHFHVVPAPGTAPKPPFELGTWVTPAFGYLIYHGAKFIPGVAYRVDAWTQGPDGRDRQIRLEGKPGFYGAQNFKACAAPVTESLEDRICNKLDISFDTSDLSKIIDDMYRKKVAQKSIFGPTTINWATPTNKDPAMSIIPPLEIPAAPQPEPLPPESPSVQMLRKLVADRRRTLASAKNDWQRHQDVVAHFEAQIADVRKMITKRNAEMSAAEAAIAEALADIEKLGGRPEEVVS